MGAISCPKCLKRFFSDYTVASFAVFLTSDNDISHYDVRPTKEIEIDLDITFRLDMFQVSSALEPFWNAGADLQSFVDCSCFVMEVGPEKRPLWSAERSAQRSAQRVYWVSQPMRPKWAHPPRPDLLISLKPFEIKSAGEVALTQWKKVC